MQTYFLPYPSSTHLAWFRMNEWNLFINIGYHLVIRWIHPNSRTHVKFLVCTIQKMIKVHFINYAAEHLHNNTLNKILFGRLKWILQERTYVQRTNLDTRTLWLPVPQLVWSRLLSTTSRKLIDELSGANSIKPSSSLTFGCFKTNHAMEFLVFPRIDDAIRT